MLGCSKNVWMCLFKCMFVCVLKSFAFWNVFVFLAISQPPQCREETLKTVKMISFCSRLHSITAAEGLAKGEVTTFTGLIYFHPDKKTIPKLTSEQNRNPVWWFFTSYADFGSVIQYGLCLLMWDQKQTHIQKVFFVPSCKGLQWDPEAVIRWHEGLRLEWWGWTAAWLLHGCCSPLLHCVTTSSSFNEQKRSK